MNKEELVKKLAGYTEIAFKKSAATLNEDTVISAELGTNSMKRITMCSLIEKNLDVVIPVSQFGKFQTLGDLADHVLAEL